MKILENKVTTQVIKTAHQNDTNTQNSIESLTRPWFTRYSFTPWNPNAGTSRKLGRRDA